MKKFLDYMNEPKVYTRQEKWFINTMIFLFVLNDMAGIY